MPSHTSTFDEPGDGTPPTTAAAGRASSAKRSLVEGDDGASPRLYTPAEAAELLTVRETWLRRQAGQQRIPCTLIGRHLRFSRRDVDAIIAAGARPAKPARRRPRSRRT